MLIEFQYSIHHLKVNKMQKTLCLIAFLFTGIANATIITADFRTEADLPYCCNDSGPLVHESLSASVGIGDELTEANFLSNPSSWSGGLVYIDLDPTTNIVTLSSQDNLDFEIFSALISNIVFDAGEVITGLSWISGNITDTSVAEMLSFTANSISIVYDVGDGNNVFDFNETQAQFQIHTDSSVATVPAPSSILLLGLGLISLGLRKKVTV